eukprot:scaffold55095_cov18-Phaeocystis_antarctica.AAC.1
MHMLTMHALTSMHLRACTDLRRCGRQRTVRLGMEAVRVHAHGNAAEGLVRGRGRGQGSAWW